MPGSAATAKRPAVAAESAGGGGYPAAPASPAQACKRVALGNITNAVAGAGGGRACSSRKDAAAAAGIAMSNSATSAASVKKVSLASTCNGSSGQGSAVKLALTKPAPAAPYPDNTAQRHNVPPVVHVPSVVPAAAPCSGIVSPLHSGDSDSIDETMSTSESMKCPESKYLDNREFSMHASSLDQKANQDLTSEDSDETKCKNNAPAPMEIDHVSALDKNHEDLQFFPSLASDMYMLLREAESKKRPSTDYMETIQNDITPSIRAILIDWLVEVAEEYRLVPDTLYLTVNYIDRFLSGNKISRQRLQLLGVACMLIAAKHEEICAPHVEEFCYITDNTYFRDEVLEMEASVLDCLNMEMNAPTAKCFLRRFLHVAQACDEDPTNLEVLANYVAELSLLEYNLLSYPPSLIASSAIFLAKFILRPTKHPWNPTLARYTKYKPSDLWDCVKALHCLFSSTGNLPAVREKYSQHKYKFVAKMGCPVSIPTGFFRDAMC